MNVLFVCRANVSRSQAAEAYFNAMSDRDAVSAGTDVSKQGKEGQTLKEAIEAALSSGIPAHELDVLGAQGFDLSDNVRKQVTPQMAEQASKIVVMIPQDALPAFLLNNGKTVYWDIPDTLKKSYDFTDKVYDQIRNRVEELVKDIG